MTAKQPQCSVGMWHIVTSWIMSNAYFLGCASDYIFPLNIMMYMISGGKKENILSITLMLKITNRTNNPCKCSVLMLTSTCTKQKVPFKKSALSKLLQLRCCRTASAPSRSDCISNTSGCRLRFILPQPLLKVKWVRDFKQTHWKWSTSGQERNRSNIKQS